MAATAGHYQGLLSEKRDERTAQTPIVADVTAPYLLQLEMKVTTAGAEPRNWQYRLQATKRGAVTLTDLNTNAAIPLKSTAEACYINSDAPSDAQASTRLCYQSNQITLDAPGAGQSMSFIMNRAAAGALPTLEPPADFKLSELTDRAIKRSFSSQIEFQSVVQARLSSENAHLNLIPHFSLGMVFDLVSSTTSMLGLVRMIGNIAPFLLPSNWFKAREAAFQSQAERYGYLLMQADAGNISAGLAYGIARDHESLLKMREERGKVADVRVQIHDLERLGFLPKGSTDSIDSVLYAADKTILDLQSTIDAEYTGLAQAVGFLNPHAVHSVTIDTDLSVENPETFDERQAQAEALERASELKQMDFLIAAARTQRTSRYFDWLDPGGNGGSIGFGMGSYIAIGSSQVQQTILKRQQLQGQILQNVADNISRIGESVASFELARKNLVIQNSLVDHYFNQLRLGINVPSSDLILAFGGQMQANLDLINARYQYLVAHENMERTLYRSHYSSLGVGPTPHP